VLALALLAAIATAAGCGAGGEDAPRDLNARFLSPDLDVERWVATFEGESREIARSRDAIVAAVDLAPGARVVDIGAGTGLFLRPFADAVGPEGRVYANEISPRFLEHLRQRADEEALAQVAVVVGGARTTGLPDAAVDVAFLCDVYHHFSDPAAMLADVRRTLAPGGRLVVVDFERIPGTTRDWIVEHVRADKAAFRREIEAAGFEFDGEVEVPGLSENYLLRFRRP
jgi:ubiquinone/menaquinone biosynthesis C-methylase UbiE